MVEVLHKLDLLTKRFESGLGLIEQRLTSVEMNVLKIIETITLSAVAESTDETEVASTNVALEIGGEQGSEGN